MNDKTRASFVVLDKENNEIYYEIFRLNDKGTVYMAAVLSFNLNPSLYLYNINIVYTSYN